MALDKASVVSRYGLCGERQEAHGIFEGSLASGPFELFSNNYIDLPLY